jgi:hypothetical protein
VMVCSMLPHLLHLYVLLHLLSIPDTPKWEFPFKLFVCVFVLL